MSESAYNLEKLDRKDVIAQCVDFLVLNYYEDLWKVISCGDTEVWTAFPIEYEQNGAPKRVFSHQTNSDIKNRFFWAVA